MHSVSSEEGMTKLHLHSPPWTRSTTLLGLLYPPPQQVYCVELFILLLMAWDEALQQAMNLFEELLVAVPAGIPKP